jgi:hypothetical protein
MNNLARCILLLLLLFMKFSSAFSQVKEDTTKTVQKVVVKMKNGDEFSGTILKQDENTVTLKTENGELNLLTKNIKSIENDTNTSRFSFANPHDTRTFFGPTGIPIKKKKGYYQNVLLTTNFINVGITKNISLGGGFEFISTITGNPIWFFTPKVGFDLGKNSHVAGGVLMAGLAGEGVAALGYGIYTLGNSESNFNIGAGYGFYSGEASKMPTLLISASHRVSRSIAIMSENYVLPIGTFDSGYIGIHGIRILSPKNAFDIGALILPGISQFIAALPFVGYARSF